LLMTAVFTDAIKCIRILLENTNVDVNFTDNDWFILPVLWLAAFYGKEEAVRELIKSDKIDVHKGAKSTLFKSVDNGYVTIDITGLSPLDAATIELNNLLDKKKNILNTIKTGFTKDDQLEKKIGNYRTIIALLASKGAVYTSTNPPEKMRRRVVRGGGKSKRRRKKIQSKKRRSRKHKK